MSRPNWEYPQAEDRGGQAADKENYVSLAKELTLQSPSRSGKLRTRAGV